MDERRDAHCDTDGASLKTHRGEDGTSWTRHEGDESFSGRVICKEDGRRDAVLRSTIMYGTALRPKIRIQQLTVAYRTRPSVKECDRAGNRAVVIFLNFAYFRVVYVTNMNIVHLLSVYSRFQSDNKRERV